MAVVLIRMLGAPYLVFGCFVVFFLSRLALIFFVPLEPASDAAWYFARAQDIAAGAGYSEGGTPTAYWPVGYPGFLGVLFTLFGGHKFVGQIANLFLATTSLYLVLQLARYLFSSETAARLAIVLITFYPNNAAYVPQLVSETYLTFLVLLGSYLVITKRQWASILMAGCIFGLAALTKPQMVFLPGCIIVMGLIWPAERGETRAYLAKGIVIYIVMAVVLVPWAVRNTLVFGEIVLSSTNGGAALLVGNNPSATGGYAPEDPLVAQRDWSVDDQVAADRRAKGLAVQWIKDNPSRFIELIPLKVWELWFKDGESEWSYQLGYEHYDKYWYVFRAIRIFNQVFYSLLIAGFVASIVLLRQGGHDVTWPWVLLGYIVAGYVTLISTVFFGYPRYHFPVMPWIVMYTSWALMIWLKRSIQTTVDPKSTIVR